MKQRFATVRRSALAAVAAAATFIPMFAGAQGKAEIGNVVSDNLLSPDIELKGGKQKNFKPKEWLELEVSMKIPAVNAEQKKVGYINEATVKWYLAFNNPEGSGVMMTSKTLNHINIPVDEEIFTSVYLSPDMIKRITGKDGGGKAAVKAVGVEVLVNGEKVGQAAEKEKAGWWTSGKISDMSTKFPLLKKDETPFAMLWYDRYAPLQKER